MTLIQTRRGTAAQWTAANPVLAIGEMGLETDTLKIKFGDGTANWAARTYLTVNAADIVAGLLPAARLPAATGAVQGAMSAADKTIFDASTFAATVSTLMERDAVGRAQVADPAVAADIATKGYTDTGLATKAATVHTHIVTSLSDSTVIGRSVLTSVDATAVRTAIGAGTSSLALGTTGSTALAGNTTFAFSQITGTISTAQLPPLAVNEVFAPATQAARLALTAERGDVAIQVDTGKTYILATDSPSTLADWKLITAVGDVASVAGRTGAVVLVKADVGLANVDNTSDVSKPVSTATATSIATKEPTLAAGTAAQYYRGDKAWVALDKTAAGLANVDNTSDVNKPVSTAQATSIATKEPSFAAGTTAQYRRGDKSWQTLDKTAAGLPNVDNTSDVNKPVSTATATSIATKEPTLAAGTTAQYYRGDKTWQTLDGVTISVIDGGTP